MTPEEHQKRGQKWLDDAERSYRGGSWDLVKCEAALAQAQFAAASAGAALRTVRVVLSGTGPHAAEAGAT